MAVYLCISLCIVKEKLFTIYFIISFSLCAWICFMWRFVSSIAIQSTIYIQCYEHFSYCICWDLCTQTSLYSHLLCHNGLVLLLILWYLTQEIETVSTCSWFVLFLANCRTLVHKTDLAAEDWLLIEKQYNLTDEDHIEFVPCSWTVLRLDRLRANLLI